MKCIFRSSLLLNTNIIAKNKIGKIEKKYNWTCAGLRYNFSECRQLQSQQSVADFYAGKSVFLTGATGFIGRLLIERLLYTCKDIEKVYILIRPKENGTVQQRLQELLDNPLFSKLKATRPQDLSKIVAISGDVANINLGMKEADEETLIEKVSVVFHSAANVKFRAPLSDLMRVNYEGTKKVMEIGKKMKNLDVFLYVSTIFTNSDNVVEEMPCPPPEDIDEVYNLLSNHSNEPNRLKRLLGDRGNSYVFSKKMTEGYVARNHGNMRTIIVRPSMVTSVYKEPTPGYVDSWVAGTGLLCDIASGLTRVVHGNKKIAVEMIPVDYVCNFLIVAAAHTNRDIFVHRNNELSVYNYTTGNSNPITWERVCKMYIEESKHHGYAILPFPMVYFTTVSWKISIITFLSQLISFGADTYLRLTGRQPRYMKLQNSATSRSPLSQPVTDVHWNIHTARARALATTLNHEDRNVYPCDPSSVDWNKYVPIYCKGVKQYMLGNKN